MKINRDWVAEEAVEELTVRRALQGMEDPIKLAADLIKEALPLATMSMTHLAIHGEPQLRFQASKYLMDKALDGKNVQLPDSRPAWDKVFDSVLVEVNDALKGNDAG